MRALVVPIDAWLWLGVAKRASRHERDSADSASFITGKIYDSTADAVDVCHSWLSARESSLRGESQQGKSSVEAERRQEIVSHGGQQKFLCLTVCPAREIL